MISSRINLISDKIIRKSNRIQKSKMISFFILFVFLISTISVNFGNVANDNNQELTDNQIVGSEEYQDIKKEETIQNVETEDNLIVNNEPTIEIQSDQNQISDNVNDIDSEPDRLTWYDYARLNNNKVSALNGTLNVHAQVVGSDLPNAYVEIVNQTGTVITSGITDSNGNISFILEENTYIVKVNQTTNYTSTVTITNSVVKTVIATFGYLEINTEDGTFSPVSASIELRNATTNNLLVTGLSTDSGGLLNITVATGTYNIFGNYNYGQTKNGIAVTESIITIVNFTFGDVTGKFGALKVSSSGFMNMPLTTSVNLKYYSSGQNIESRNTNNIDGSYTWPAIAPDVYTITFTESASTIVFPNVLIEENIQTNLSAQFGFVIVYQDNTTITFVEVWEQGNPTRLTYAWISTTTKLVRFVLAPANYTIGYSGQFYSVSVNAGGKVLINSQINSRPQKTSPANTAVIANPARINANDSTNITVRITDVNVDYDTMIFTYTPNVGSVSTQWNRFSKEDEYKSDIIYTAPSTLQTMYIDVNVSDGYLGSFFTFRLYVSNQTATVYANSTIFGGIGLSGTFIEIYSVNTGTRLSYNWANATGWVTFSNVNEDEYYLQATERNIPQSLNFQLLGNQIYYYNFKWATLKINSTGLNSDLIDTPITVYNQTVDISTVSSQTTVLTGDGTRTWYLSEGTYYARASESNSLYKYDLILVAEQETYYEFKFSVMAVYYLDDNNNTAQKFVEIFNGTNVGGPRLFYGWTSSTTGFVVFILAPNNNYTVLVTHNATFKYYYENISLLPNDGVYVGQFVNSAPTITSYSASPSVVLPNQTTTITIIATDPDVLDVLIFEYIPSMGTITGNNVNFIAPSYYGYANFTAPAFYGFYYLNISVIDPNGAYDNITRAVSSRTVDFVIHVRDSLGVPLVGNFVELYDWTLGTRQTYSWTDSSGNVTFSTILENFFYIQATASNIIQLNTKIYSADTPVYYVTITFGLLYVNSKKAGNVLESTPIQIIDNVTTNVDTSSSTLTTGDGYYRFELRPGVYDLRATEQNTLRMEDVLITTSGTVNKTFNWAVLNVTSLSHYSMPLNSFIEVYNKTTNIRVTYGWANTATGQVLFIIAPSNDYQVRVTEDNVFVQNISVIANQQIDIVAEFGVIRVTRLDGSNNPQSGQNFRVYNQTTLVQQSSRNTNTNGQVFFLLIPGVYQVNSTTLGISYSNVVVYPLQRTDLGDVYNNNPVILSVTPSPARIGFNSSTTIRIEVKDDNYDYEALQANFVLSTGNLGVLTRSWTSLNQYYFEITYFSPFTSGFYQINITISDGSGGSADYMLVVSNRQGTLNVHSLSNLFQGVVTAIQVTKVNDGQTFSQNTGIDGLSSFVLYDDLYIIRGTEGNQQFIYNVWVLGGEMVNVTFFWGDLVVYSTGAGGVPLFNTFIEIYEMADLGTRVTYAWTNSEGFVKFTLRPGLYRVALRETTDIIFDNIEIVAGETLNLGSDIPKVTKPSDLLFFSGTTGNTVSWTLTDDEPAFYNVTLDGVLLINSTVWVNGTIVSVNLDYLTPGKYFLIINVNDTKGFAQSDLVVITVSSLNNTAPNFLITPSDFSYELFTTGYIISWTINDTNADTYLLYRNGNLISSGLWTPNVSLGFNVDSLAVGTYTYLLTVNDTNNEVISDTVIVTVINSAPTINSPSDLTFDAGTTGNTFSWTAVDIHAQKFVIYKNNVKIVEGTWISNSPILIVLDELLPGTYEIKIIVYDSQLLSATDTVVVTVNDPVDPIPTHQASITSPSDITFFTTDSNQILTWKATYTYASGVEWKLLVDGTAVQSGGLLNNTYYVFNMSDLNLQPGLHKITFEIIIEDFNNNQFTYSDTAVANVIFQEILNPGKNEINLEGESETSIEIDVDSSVQIIVITSVVPTSNESADALKDLENSEGYTETQYYIDIEIADDTVLNGIWINISYANWDLEALGIEESTLKIFFFNDATNKWEPAGDTGVDIQRKIIYAYITHLTAFAAVAIPAKSPDSSASSSFTAFTSDALSSIEPPGAVFGFEWIAIFSIAIIPVLRRRKD